MIFLSILTTVLTTGDSIRFWNQFKKRTDVGQMIRLVNIQHFLSLNELNQHGSHLWNCVGSVYMTASVSDNEIRHRRRENSDIIDVTKEWQTNTVIVSDRP